MADGADLIEILQKEEERVVVPEGKVAEEDLLGPVNIEGDGEDDEDAEGDEDGMGDDAQVDEEDDSGSSPSSFSSSSSSSRGAVLPATDLASKFKRNPGKRGKQPSKVPVKKKVQNFKDCCRAALCPWQDHPSARRRWSCLRLLPLRG